MDRERGLTATGKYIKMVWDCEYCSKKGIPGDVRNCPGCGNPCGSNVKYYIPNKKEYVSETVVPDGPDWQCAYCDSYNRYNATVCSNCGADRKGTKDYFGKTVDSSDDNAEDYSDGDTERVVETYDNGWSNSDSVNSNSTNANSFDVRSYSSFNSGYSGAARPNIKGAIIKRVLIIVSILAVICGLVYIFVPKEKELTVAGISWERSVTIDRYETVAESDWHLPSNARLRYTRQEIRRYETVQDGYKTEEYTEQVIDHYDKEVTYKDLGNGYAEEVVKEVPVYKTVTKTREVPKYKEVPIYDTKYYYDIDKYVYNRVIKVQNSDKSPYWPENLPVEKSNPVIGDERVASRSEKYMIAAQLKGKDGLKEYTLDYNEWNDLNIGDTIKCKVYINGKIDIIYNE